MNVEIGSLVISRCGKDSGMVLAVISMTETHLVLADGRRRRVEKPKQKKIKHVTFPGKSLDAEIVEMLAKGNITNKMLYNGIRRSLMN